MKMSVEELHQFLRGRRSVRRFQPRSVERTTLERILQTAMYAPSAHNRQPWRFAVLTEQTQKQTLAHAMATEFARDLAADGLPAAEVETLVSRSKNRIQEAPVIVILCVEMNEMDVYPDEKRQQAEFVMATQSTSLAGLQLQLAAHAEGLGSVWVCAPLFAAETVRGSLGLPNGWQPQGMIFLGYAVGEPKEKIIKPLEQVTLFL